MMNAQNSSLQRKERNEQLLTRLGIPVNPNLPRVESEAETKLRNPQDVAKRAIVLYFVISVAHEANRRRRCLGSRMKVCGV